MGILVSLQNEVICLNQLHGTITYMSCKDVKLQSKLKKKIINGELFVFYMHQSLANECYITTLSSCCLYHIKAKKLLSIEINASE